ncbi:ankyrin repeat domain-containing protein [Wolbachia endosymbiont of Oedothorax gibbosus]|uniref:ankyrin repeat domain-containing protein n=1 Tax=Wolbachia endosymbiont of Oedothorax gibbosus TaxID=931100 RepID=UPI00202556D0|nr:ankyrin repeat domain-containing protein [Wolbachia endosymbiont of Oedothorax gibbosus]
MSIDLSALATNAKKLDEYIDKNEKREWERKEKDEQLYGTIERKVKKEKHKHEKPRGQDGALKKCKRLFEEGASSEVLTKLEESLREQEKYYRYYVQCFLPVLNRKISKELDPIKKEEIGQVISEITYNSRYCNKNDRRDSETESGYGSDIEDDHKVEISNEITNSNALLLKAIKNGNNRKFEKYLKNCTDINSVKGEKDNNILHLIVSLEKKQKCKFLDILIKTFTKEDLAQLINSENQDALQVALINKITKEKHVSHTIRSNDNTLKFFVKLLRHGASPGQLELPEESLKKLPKEQNEYYLKFLKKLVKLSKKSELNQETKNSVITKVADIVYDGYPLHKTVSNRDKDKNKFSELLQSGYDITTKDADGNTVLHCAVELDGRAKYDFTKLILEKNKKLVNTPNKEQQTPLHQLLQHIKEKNEDRSCTDRKFEKTNRYKALELFLQNGADITVQDKDGKNALHYIASFKGEQKVTCLELILNSVEKEKFSKAANATNEKERTPLQVALITKTTKNKHNLVNPKSRDNTIKFCVKLLQNGVDPKQLILPERLWSKEYYKTIKGIEKSMGRALIPDDMRTELKCNFGKKLKARDIVKYVNNVVCKVVTTLVFTALACAVIFSASQGSITIATASSIIAVIGVCYLIYLNLENIYEGFGKIKGKFTEEKQLTLQDNAPKNDTQCNNSVKDIENKSNDLEEQEVQKSSSQSEYTENPATKMSDISILRQFINKLVGNVL